MKRRPKRKSMSISCRSRDPFKYSRLDLLNAIQGARQNSPVGAQRSYGKSAASESLCAETASTTCHQKKNVQMDEVSSQASKAKTVDENLCTDGSYASLNGIAFNLVGIAPSPRSTSLAAKPSIPFTTPTSESQRRSELLAVVRRLVHVAWTLEQRSTRSPRLQSRPPYRR